MADYANEDLKNVYLALNEVEYGDDGTAVPVIMENPEWGEFEPGEREKWHVASKEEYEAYEAYWNAKDDSDSPAEALTSKEEEEETVVPRKAADLIGGDRLIGELGNITTVFDVEESSAIPGLIHLTTEHGHLYLDPEQEVQLD